MDRLSELRGYFHDDSAVAILMDAAEAYTKTLKHLQELGHLNQGDDKSLWELDQQRARVASLFVQLHDACCADETNRAAQLRTLLVMGAEAFTLTKEIFVPATEPTLTEKVDAKFGPVEDYQVCPHGLVHGIGCILCE